MKSFKQYLNESNGHLNHFVGFACHHLGISHPPKIHLIHDKKEAQKQKSFGGYHPESKAIYVNTAGRHPVDVMRTLAHELVHYRQDINGELEDGAGETGTPQENEANAEAAIIMRNWGKKHPDLFEKDSIA